MTKEEFYHEMLAIEEIYADDPEMFHIVADKLLCDLLIKLGYGQGVEVFLDADRWYS